MSWKIDIPYDRNSPYIVEDIDDAVRLIVESDQYQDNYEIGRDAFDEFVDDSYGEIDVCGISYSASQVLRDVDEYRYDEWYREECLERARDSEYDVECELESNEHEGGSAWFAGNVTASYIEDEEEEDEGHDEDEVFDCFAN